jgi:filamentous hemagglutinin family protein
MNRIHRIIWSKIREKWTVVSEKSGASGCPIITVGALSLAALLATTSPASALDSGALPTGGRITSGSGTIASSGSQMTVTQNSAKLLANWNTFNIGESASVRFAQPDAASTVLNRIADQNPSLILGSLSSNGTVFLINQNGLVFGKSAKVDVGGLVASTLNLSDSDFLNGRYPFSGIGNAGKIENLGTITAMPGGVVALIAPKVTNEGQITADKGSVAMLAGDQVTVDFNGDGMIRYAVGRGSVDALAENNGLISADGGLVVMSAEAADALSRAVVNNGGEIRAHTLENRGGRIVLVSDMEYGTMTVDGKLDASAPDGGDGGFVETSGAKVRVAESAVVDTRADGGATGTWLIDPNDYTIAASGGDATGASISSQLASTNVTIRTSTMGHSGGNGDIFVNDSITWSSHLLTLNAERNITINSSLYGSNTAGLSLLYGQGSGGSGNYTINAPVNLATTGSFSTKLAGGSLKSYTIITTLSDLQGINGDLSGSYVLGSNISATDTSTWNPDGSGGYSGFNPIGDDVNPFTGIFDGLGHNITGLTINRSSMYLGLFGCSSGTTISNVGLVGASITGTDIHGNVGGLIGYNDQGTVINCNIAGMVNGGLYVGGLAGFNDTGTITNSYNTATVIGKGSVGGLIGENTGSLINAYNTGSVTGSNDAGSVGGLVGYSGVTGSITNSYSTGPVVGTGSGNYVGGLVGINYSEITRCYSTGLVTGRTQSAAGGLVGGDGGGVYTSLFWDTESSGTLTGIGLGNTSEAFGRTTSEMMQASTFSAWSIADASGSGAVWRIYGGHTYPLLRSFLTPLTITANDAATVYNGQAYSIIDALSYSINGVSMSNLHGTDSYSALSSASNPTLAIHVDTYTIKSKAYSDQLGYDISYVDGTLTINPKQLVVSLTNNGVSKVYDGTAVTTATASYSVSGLVDAGESAAITSTGTLSYNTSHVVGSSYLTIGGVSVTGISGGTHGSLSSDYSLPSNVSAQSAAGSATITAAPLTASLANSGVTKVYDGTPQTAATALYSVSGLVDAGESATVTASGALSYNTSHVIGSSYLTINGVSVTGISGGTHGSLSSDYALTGATARSAAGSATITAAPLTVSLTNSGATKVYDGTAVSTATPLYSVSGFVDAGESATVTASGTLSYNTSHVVGSSYLTIAGLSLSAISGGTHGSQASDYALTGTTAQGIAGSATITPEVIDLYGMKPYDGNVNFIASSFGDKGVISGIGSETLILTGTGTVASPEVLAGRQALATGDLTLTGRANGGVATDYTLSGGNHSGTVQNISNLPPREISDESDAVLKRLDLQSTNPDDPFISAADYALPHGENF